MQGQKEAETVTINQTTYTAFAPISADAQHRNIPSICKVSVHALLAHDNTDRVRRLGRKCLLVSEGHGPFWWFLAWIQVLTRKDR